MDQAALRILDANLNRAREALRVIEEYARFVRDDPAAAEQVKQARHELRRIVDTIGADRLLAARDIINDVGRELKTTQELERGSIEDVVQASFARLTEATRVLGEYGKLISPEAARLAEQLRYHTYELQQCVVLRSSFRARFRQARLYVLLTESLCKRGWYETAEAVLAGGADVLQLREKDLPDSILLERARRLRALTARHNALFIVNDRPDIAILCGADGVHVGQDDMSVAEVRRVAGADPLVGKSTHTPEQFEQALTEEPDYLAVGPMFASPTKPGLELAGIATLEQVAGQTELALAGIGGIAPNNTAEVLRAGAGCVCVCSAIIGADDPARAVAEFRSAIARAG